MATLGFLRRDFQLFAIEDRDLRMAKIDELIRPRLTRLASEMASELSRRLQVEVFPHVPRRMENHEACAAFAPSPKGYKRTGHLALCISRVGIRARATVKSNAEKRTEIGQAIRSRSAELERSFRGTKIQNYNGWDGGPRQDSIVASRDFFDELGDALAKKSGSIDVGFGWPIDHALSIDRAEVIDAFAELSPLYRLLGP